MGLARWIQKRRAAAAVAVEDQRLRAAGLCRSIGERQYPAEPGTLLGLDPDHVFRYEWAKPFCDGRVVLDYGCGTGYGSYVLSDGAKKVVGHDTSPEALAWAAHYAARASNLSFTSEPPADIFDCITCFECIEHVPDPEATLDWLASHARECVLISTPEPPEKGSWSPFHTREFSQDEFFAVLSRRLAIEHHEIQHTSGCRVVLARCKPL